MNRKSVLILIFFIKINFIFSQESSINTSIKNGLWYTSNTSLKKGDFTNKGFFMVMNDSVFSGKIDDEGTFSLRKPTGEYNFIENTIKHRNNTHYSWLAGNKNGGWCETQNFDIFYIGNPYIYLYKHSRFVNNYDTNKRFNTFSDKEKSFADHSTGYFRPVAYLLWDDVEYSAKSNSFVEITNVIVTDFATEITFSFNEENKRFGLGITRICDSKIVDNEGNVYKYLDQFKLFKGPIAEECKGKQLTYNIKDRNYKFEFILYFEKLPLNIKQFNITGDNLDFIKFFEVREKKAKN